MGASEPRWPAYVREEIENWIVACWDGQEPGPQDRTQCGSLEGGYSAPAWYPDDLPPPRRCFNREAADRVQRIFERMPQVTRQVLRFEYTNRSQYDQWEEGLEIGADGVERRAWHRTGNNKRERAQRALDISRAIYDECVRLFKDSVAREFA